MPRSRQLKDQCPFEAIGDDHDIGGPPFGIKRRSQRRKGVISPNVVHRLLPDRALNVYAIGVFGGLMQIKAGSGPS
jgi:hypothetical protein